MLDKWSEQSLAIRSKGLEEPNLYHFEKWLQKRVLAKKEVDPPEPKSQKQKKPPEDKAHCNLTKMKDSKAPEHPTPVITPCSLCEGKHAFWKCESYKTISDGKKFDTVKKSKRCFNCLGSDHALSQCNSKLTCLIMN